MWELDQKEGWAPENWCFWTVVLEKTLESPLDCKKIKPVNSKGNGPWIFIGRTDAEAEVPVLWPPDAKSQLIGKDLDAGKPMKAGGEGGGRGWDSWMASLTQRTWVWVNSRSWWWTGRSGMLWSMGLQRVGHDWTTELNWNARDFRDVGLITGWETSPGEGNGNPLQYPYLENPRDGGAWWAAVYGVAQSRTWLSDLAAAAAEGKLTFKF